MTSLAIFSAKRTDEKVPLQFNFADQLLFGETITGQVVTAVVFSGTDIAPEAILFGAPTLSGNTITQIVFDGVEGVIYLLVCVVTGSSGHMYSKEGKLAIVNSPNSFTGL